MTRCRPASCKRPSRPGDCGACARRRHCRCCCSPAPERRVHQTGVRDRPYLSLLLFTTHIILLDLLHAQSELASPICILCMFALGAPPASFHKLPRSSTPPRPLPRNKPATASFIKVQLVARPGTAGLPHRIKMQIRPQRPVIISQPRRIERRLDTVDAAEKITVRRRDHVRVGSRHRYPVEIVVHSPCHYRAPPLFIRSR